MINRLKLLSSAAALACVSFLTAGKRQRRELRIRWSELRPADQAAGMVVLAVQRGNDAAERRDAVQQPRGQADRIDRLSLAGRSRGRPRLRVPAGAGGAGCCSHMPPPPPNQAVHVFPAKPYKMSETYEPVTISGTLKPELEKTQLFILDGVAVIESGYTSPRPRWRRPTACRTRSRCRAT